MQRAQSPSEQLASAARALSPVRYFLRPTENGDFDGSGDFTSFTSLGSGEISYDYRQEEEFVRAAQAAAKTRPRDSDTKRKKHKAVAEDLPYRPGEDDYGYDSEESEGEGEGIVQNGALNGRAGTRGKRAERGEGCLGMGLGLVPRARRKSRKSGDAGGVTESEDEVNEYNQRSHSPVAEAHQANGYRRSPTPAQLLRALSPRATGRSSPMPGYNARKRQPAILRALVTRLLHGIVMGLRFFVDLIGAIINALIIKPIRGATNSGEQILRRLRQNWWKWIGGLVALSLALRVLKHPWRSRSGYHAPDVPPGSLEELISRLTHLEHAFSSLSESSKAQKYAEGESKRASESALQRIIWLEGSAREEHNRLDGLLQDTHGSVKGAEESVGSFQSEISRLTNRIGFQEKGLISIQGALTKLDSVDRKFQLLDARVDEVERGVHSALEDGRLRTALARILPESMPVKVNSKGTVDIDPVFWTEMKKVLVGKGEVEGLVRSLMEDGTKEQSLQSRLERRSEKELDIWADRLFERKAASGVIISRSDFIQVLEGEVSNLRQFMEETSRKTAGPAPATRSSVTIKSAKGDDLTSMFNILIDAALLRYSKDTIARPDYALFTAGGRVVPSITSDTLVMRSPSRFERWLLGRKDVEGRSPATALHPDSSVGSCWPFQGDKGQLGVLLTRRVVVTDLTVEHAASDVALDVSTAPRNIEVVGDVFNKRGADLTCL